MRFNVVNGLFVLSLADLSADHRCDRGGGVRYSLDFNPGPTAPHRLCVPPPLLPANLQGHQAT